MAQIFSHVWRQKICAGTNLLSSDVGKYLCHSTNILSSDVAKIFLFSLWNLRFLKKVHHFSDKTFFKPTKKPEKWKKHSVLIFVLATTFVKICPCLIWQFPKLPRYKKGNLGNISQPRPTASASKNFSSVPFFLPR